MWWWRDLRLLGQSSDGRRDLGEMINSLGGSFTSLGVLLLTCVK